MVKYNFPASHQTARQMLVNIWRSIVEESERPKHCSSCSSHIRRSWRTVSVRPTAARFVGYR